MTFDEANKIVEAFDEDPELEDWMPDSKVYEIIECLRKEYAPTVEMTKKQYNTFKWHKDNLDFSACLGTFQNYNGETRMGHKFDDLKGDLSDEDIMQAWLHPETIKIVDE